MSTELEEVCGNFPENYTPLDIASDPSFIFENDPAYTAVQLWDKEGNTIFVNSFTECNHYFDGGWSFNPIVMQEEQLQIYALLFFVTTFFIFKFIEKFYNAKK